MAIKTETGVLIYQACLLCQAIEELEEFVSSNIIYKKIATESAFMRVIMFKEKWKAALSANHEAKT